MPETAPHKPGPFEYHPGGYGRYHPEDDGQYHGFLSVPESNTTVTVYADTLDELNAVCSLIAAAPDLLAALQQMRRQFDTYRRTHEQAAACAAADAAIAKATGNSQDAAYDAHAARYPVADAAAEAARAAPADGMVCKIPMPSGRRACDALPLDDCPCRSAEAGEKDDAGNSQDAPTPAPGTDATTADGRFVSGPGYGGERM